MAKIVKVLPNSLAKELDLRENDEILSINGQKVEDILDYHVLISDDYVEIEVKKENGEVLIYEVDKNEDETLGVEWQNPTIDKIKLCHNKCVFCFVDQIPLNMRKSLQIRDDDYRLSFLQGNYITLTNVTLKDLERIVALRLSPINISVHTMNPILRMKMLGNRTAGDLRKQIQYLAENGITMHTQVVLCPTYNDDKELENTIRELRSFFPLVKTLSIVPVGLTAHRKHLTNLQPVSREDAIKAIDTIDKWQKKNIDELGYALVYGADELYVLADQDVPSAAAYDDFEQTENGVGLIRLFLDDVIYYSKFIVKSNSKRKYLLLTGVSSEKTIEEAIKLLTNNISIEIKYHVIPNRFYGEQVTVTGLVTGYDIVNELMKSDLNRFYHNYDKILIPDIMLKENEDVFLDNLRVSDVELKIGKKLTVVQTNAKSLIQAIAETSLDVEVRENTNQEGQIRSKRYERCDIYA